MQHRNFGHRDVLPLFLGEQVGCVAKTHLHSHRVTKRCVIADSTHPTVTAGEGDIANCDQVLGKMGNGLTPIIPSAANPQPHDCMS